MTSLFSGQTRLIAFAVIWVQISALLAGLLRLSGSLSPTEAIALAVPLAALYAVVCLAVHFLARATPVRADFRRAAMTHGATSLVSASLWVLAGRGWVEVLSWTGETRREALFPLPDAAFAPAGPIIFGVGFLVMLLALALHHMLIAMDESRAAATRAVEAQLHAREAELKALHAQIQPHFLFNSLNSISALIRSDPDAARRTCLLLGELLRQSLSLAAREQITLAEELKLTEALLSIEKVRFGDRLTFDAHIDDDVASTAVPPLLLQPLVENAVTHGISQLLDGGSIHIRVRRMADRLELSVENPRDAAAATRSGAGVGLENVRRRLAATYGRAAELRVERRETAFRVEISLPLMSGPQREPDLPPP
jgi:hypothetical protein